MLILKIPLGREVHSTDEETVNTFLRWRNRKGRASECQLAHWRAGAVHSTHSSSLCLTWANTNFDCFELSFPLLPFSPFLFSFSFLPTSTFFTSVGKLPSHDTDARHYDTQGGPRAPYLSAGSQASGGPTPFPLPWCHLKRQLHFSLGSFRLPTRCPAAKSETQMQEPIHWPTNSEAFPAPSSRNGPYHPRKSILQPL